MIRSPRSYPRQLLAEWYLAGGAPTPLAVYQPINAPSLAASYVNLVNPGTYDAAPGVAPTHSPVTGWGFDGTSQYLTTGVVPAAGWAIIARFSNVTLAGAAQAVAGSWNTAGSTRFVIYPWGSPERGYAYGSSFIRGGVAASASGVIGMAAGNGYFNGELEVSFGAWSGAGRAITIGVSNRTTGLVEWFGGNIQAVAIYPTSTDHAIWVPAVSAAALAL